MTENDVNFDEGMISWIITSGCQLLPKSSSSSVFDHMHDLVMFLEPAERQYTHLCGSMAEFYIRPLNPCISDVDFLMCQPDRLAFNGDSPVLPSDMSGLADTFVYCKIESYHRYPGFVRLRVLGEMKYSWKYKKYELIHRVCLPKIAYITSHNLPFSVPCYSTSTRCEKTQKRIVSGPAMVSKPDVGDGDFGSDNVPCVWCPQWPTEARNWPLRPRNYGWPTVDTINEVVQQGCHVVYAQHRSWREDELQWRLSFSLAEVVLLQSWSQTQQIVYHLLRFFAKREIMHKGCPKEDEIMCTYHLKTLMLWSCEQMSMEWWNYSTIIAICRELLQKLSEFLKRKHCPNYFIPEANLFHEQCNQTMLEKCEATLNTFCKSGVLCDWFVDNYIKFFVRSHANEFMKGRNGSMHFVDCMLNLFEFRKVNESVSLNKMLNFKFIISHQSCRIAFQNGCDSGLFQKSNIGYDIKDFDAKTEGTMAFLPAIKNDLCFTYLDNVLHILHAACGIGFGEISWNSNIFIELLNAMSMQPKIVKSQYHNFPISYTEQSSRFQFLCALRLMQNITGSNSSSEFQLLITTSKEILRKTLQFYDSKCNGIASAVLSYLAALHFATSEYQAAMRFCWAVIVDQTSQKVLETLNAGCLLFIDDVARLVGLCVLHKKITDINLQYIGGHLCLDLRLSPKVFAHYLAVVLAKRTFKYLDLDRDLPVSVYPFDECLKALLKPKFNVSLRQGVQFSAARQIVYCRADSFTETKVTAANMFMVKDTVIDALMRYALEHMSLFQSVFRNDFRYQCNTFDCYRALYLYKCREYDEVLHLCEQVLNEPDVQNVVNEFAFANVLLLPPLDSFFDRDVQSLLGFHTLFYYLSPLNDDMRKLEFTAESTFEHWFAIEVFSNEMPLSISTKRSNPFKRYYFLGRHFLARYLKIRCCIDCNLPYREVLFEFVAQKQKFPFENFICRYLLRKLRVFKK